MELLGFWSYVHADDETSMGRIVRLAHDIQRNYESIRAESLEVFLDADNIRWGDKWRARIDDTLANVAFFIPVITPLFFTSVECRREFTYFLEKAEALGIRQLIMPILWIDVAELHTEEPPMPLMKTVKEIQWEDWREKRFLELDSGAYQRAVFELASKLVGRVAEVERTDIVAAAEATQAEDDAEGGAGVLDRMAALEEALPRWTETLERLGAEIRRIGEIVSSGAEDMQAGDARGKGFAARLTVARRVAQDLMDPVDVIDELSQAYVADLNEIDAGYRTIVAQWISEMPEASDEERIQAEEFFTTVRGVSLSAASALENVAGMVGAMEPIESMSKDMRTPLRSLRRSLSALVEAQQVTDAWTALLDEHDLGSAEQAQVLAEEWGVDESEARPGDAPLT